MARVLIGYSTCSLTRDAFAAHGHDAYTCDLRDAPGNRHLRCDIWEALNERHWDFAVLHPMCTYLTCSAAWAFNDPDYEKYPDVGYHQRLKPGTLVGASRRQARSEALENFRRLLELPFPVAVENPGTNFASKAVRKPSQVVQPYEFGDDASKATGLWLSEGVPLLKGTVYRPPRLVCSNGHTFVYGQNKCPECGGESYLPRWANQTDSGQNCLSPSAERWLERSRTYPGLAAAMGDQWGRWLNTTA